MRCLKIIICFGNLNYCTSDTLYLGVCGGVSCGWGGECPSNKHYSNLVPPHTETNRFRLTCTSMKREGSFISLAMLPRVCQSFRETITSFTYTRPWPALFPLSLHNNKMLINVTVRARPTGAGVYWKEDTQHHVAHLPAIFPQSDSANSIGRLISRIMEMSLTPAAVTDTV